MTPEVKIKAAIVPVAGFLGYVAPRRNQGFFR